MDWVWSWWGWMWPSPLNPSKFKVDLKTCVIRTRLHKLKMQEQLQKEKGEILELVRSDKLDHARIKIEALIQRFRKIPVYDVICNYCESLEARMELLTTSGDVPSEVLGAIHTLAYAAMRVNIPELQDVVGQLKAKYGSNIGNWEVESSAHWIDKRVIDYLSVEMPSDAEINKYLYEFYGKVEASNDVISPRQKRLLEQSTENPSTPQHYSPYSQDTYYPHTPSTPSTSSPYSPANFSPLPSAPATPLHPLYPQTPAATPPEHTPPTYPHSLYPSLPTSSPHSSYVDPSLLYSTPSTSFDAYAQRAFPPPENPEFTAHMANKRVKTEQSAIKRTTPPNNKNPSPRPKLEKHGGIRKKVRTPKLKKRKSNPFQQPSPNVDGVVKDIKIAYGESSDEDISEHNTTNPDSQSDEGEDSEASEEGNETPNKSAGESEGENLLDLNSRLEALKKRGMD